MPARPDLTGFEPTATLLTGDDARLLGRSHALIFWPRPTKRARLQFVLWHVIVGHLFLGAVRRLTRQNFF